MKVFLLASSDYNVLLILFAVSLILICSLNVTQYSHRKNHSSEHHIILRDDIALGGSPSHASDNIKAQKRVQHKQQLHTPYSELENTLKRTTVRWGDFIQYPPSPLRTKHYIKPAVLKALRRCCVVNGSDQFNHDRGTMVSSKPSNGTLTRACYDSWTDDFISIWKGRRVKGLCEEGAASRISCYDSAMTGVGRSRLCVFDNAMMNFKKVRRRKVDGHLTRSWERGFLSADCGDMAADDIGYQLLYKPDIEGREDAVCDFVFNETVVVYSHDNTRSYGAMVNDQLNVWTMLWLAGLSHATGDISFLNMDAMKRGGKFNADQVNHYFKNYNASFRRILKGVDFERSKAKVCFKRLIVQPRPAIPYLTTGGSDLLIASDPDHCDTKTALDWTTNASSYNEQLHMSSLFQRWNLEIRQSHRLLQGRDSMPTMTSLQILFLARKNALGPSPAASTNSGVDAGSRLIANAQEVFDMLKSRFTSNGHLQLVINTPSSSSVVLPSAVVIMEDLSEMSSEEQLRLIGGSSVLVGMHGTGMSTSVHMPIGTKYCCGVVEIFAGDHLHKDRGLTSYGLLAKKMGHYYEQLHVPSNMTSTSGSLVPIDLLEAAVRRVINYLVLVTGTCVHPDVIDHPYL